ncbi:MAG: ABC1 kinase family protein [Phycisphaerales bacterium]
MATFSPVARRLRNAQRYVRVVEVLARHGFADVAEQIGLVGLIDKGREILGASPAKNHDLPRQVRVRTVLEELGPTYVKLGQVLSTRPDLIPQEWADEFKSLQNSVPGVEYEQIEKILEEEYGPRLHTLFRSIQKKPLAAASIAQVHKAVLHDGARIVLKVIRPGIRDVVEADMEILRQLAEIAEGYFKNIGYSPTAVVDEFAREIAKELDLAHEGRSTDRLRGYFEDDPEVVFPKVYWEATTINVLALQEIRGKVFTQLEPDAMEPETRRRLVENGTRAVFRQCLEFGFFHADPHPGNLIALPKGRIAFIDCGMTGEIDSRTARQLADLVSGVVGGDLDRVMGVVAALGDVPPEQLDDRALRNDVNTIVSQFQNTSLDQLDLGILLNDFFGALRANKISCPADLVFLIKALTTIESVGRTIDPSFPLAEFVRPFVEKLVEKRYSFSALRTRAQRSLLHYVELAEDLPVELRSLLNQFRRNKFAVNIEHRGLTRLTHTIEHASRNISFALIIASMLVGSSILILAARNAGMGVLTTIGVAGFLAAGVLVVLMIITNRKLRDD